MKCKFPPHITSVWLQFKQNPVTNQWLHAGPCTLLQICTSKHSDIFVSRVKKKQVQHHLGESQGYSCTVILVQDHAAHHLSKSSWFWKWGDPTQFCQGIPGGNRNKNQELQGVSPKGSLSQFLWCGMTFSKVRFEKRLKITDYLSKDSQSSPFQSHTMGSNSLFQCKKPAQFKLLFNLI